MLFFILYIFSCEKQVIRASNTPTFLLFVTDNFQRNDVVILLSRCNIDMCFVDPFYRLELVIRLSCIRCVSRKGKDLAAGAIVDIEIGMHK